VLVKSWTIWCVYHTYMPVKCVCDVRVPSDSSTIMLTTVFLAVVVKNSQGRMMMLFLSQVPLM